MKHFYTHEQADQDVDYHAPAEVTRQVHESVRADIRRVMHRWINLLPESPDKTVALRTLRDAMMWANATTAINGNDPAWQAEAAKVLEVRGLGDAELNAAHDELDRLGAWFMQDEMHQAMIGEGSAVTNVIRMLDEFLADPSTGIRRSRRPGKSRSEWATQEDSVVDTDREERTTLDSRSLYQRLLESVRADPETLARRFHEVYEDLAPRFGYNTRPESAKPSLDDVPARNGALMAATCAEILGVDWPSWVGRIAEDIRVDPGAHTGETLAQAITGMMTATPEDMMMGFPMAETEWSGKLADPDVADRADGEAGEQEGHSDPA